MKNTFVRYFTLGLVLLNLSACSFANPQVLKSVEHQGWVRDSDLTEISGLARSLRQESVLWALNDSGNQPVLYAINSQGKRVGSIKVKGVKNKDWEDLASFEYQSKPYLLIADVGDNEAKRDTYRLHWIKEPSPKKLLKSDGLMLKPKKTIKFRYEDGPRDCESVAVDVKNNRILLLSKRDPVPALYQLPLNPANDKKQVAKRITKLLPLPEPDVIYEVKKLKFSGFSTMPTAMDISPDGKQLAVLTYPNAYLYRLSQPYHWMELASLKPILIELPYLKQAEALSFDALGKALLITSEKLPAPLIKVTLPD